MFENSKLCRYSKNSLYWRQSAKKDSFWNVLLYDVIVWISTASTEDHQHHCLFSPAHRFTQTCSSMQKPNDKDALKTTRLCAVSSCGKNSVCIAFLLIPTLGRSGSTLFLMTFQTTSVRTLSFVHFIALQIHLQTRHNSARDFQKDWN